MKKEINFSTEREAEEYCKENHIIPTTSELCDFGWRIEYEYETLETPFKPVAKKKQACLRTICNGQTCYLAIKSGLTWVKAQAKTFELSKAIEKVSFMNKKGHYQWEVEEL